MCRSDCVVWRLSPREKSSWQKLEVTIDVKPATEDLCRTLEKSRRARGQFRQYAHCTFENSHRTFVVCVAILKDFVARLIRFDHAEAFYSDLFSVKDTTFLVDFFEFCRLSPAERGWDCTGRGAIEAEAAAAHDILSARREESLYPSTSWDSILPTNKPLHVLSIPVSKRTTRRVVACGPRTDTCGLRGWATRGYIGVDFDDRELAWMKGTYVWRIEAEGVESEVEIYKHLADCGFKEYLPDIAYGGDLFEPMYSEHILLPITCFPCSASPL
ncbi:hypothetical protein K488DRAFT_68259 [Vararia minispora EC-137]|uniref:Uncharacterized protein n=1 Tax=Vararia minispora EC-137 TaxID=1314806 RepID=A0ACB8QVJ1_9AGAM|nr:hypothetical protein K488DRAFT_68259 [Vararia minispora EC-137]